MVAFRLFSNARGGYLMYYTGEHTINIFFMPSQTYLASLILIKCACDANEL